MKLAFTICATNYLARAKVLGDSLLLHNPEYRFVIVVADRLAGVDLRGFEAFDVLAIEDLDLPQLAGMTQRYNAIELCTAVKPACFDLLLRRHPQSETVLYFDPDMMIASPLVPLEQSMARGDILLTPHFSVPVFSKPLPVEFVVLPAGVYNLGFIGLRRCANTAAFLHWWALRLEEHCRSYHKHGLFYDQSWVNFAPVFFERVVVDKHPGFNMAFWNLHERRLSRQGSRYLVNDGDPLVFFHFSGFKPCQDPAPAWSAQIDRADVEPLYREYRDALVAARYFDFIRIPFAFVPAPDRSLARRVAFVCGRMARLAKQYLPRSLVTRVRRELEAII